MQQCGVRGTRKTAPAAGDIGNIAVGHEMTSQVRDERGDSSAAQSRDGLHRRAAHRLRGLVVPSGRRHANLSERLDAVIAPRVGPQPGASAALLKFCAAPGKRRLTPGWSEPSIHHVRVLGRTRPGQLLS